MDVKLRILRFNPETDRKGHWEEYNIEADPDERILDLLHKVKWFDDGSLAFRRSCAHGVCGSDAMVVNGENMLACQVLVKEVSNPIKIEPIRGLPVIKDLVVDRTSFDRIQHAGGYISINTSGNTQDANTIPIRKEDADNAFDAATCIGCGACVATCKNASAMLFVSAKVSQFSYLPQGQVEAKDRVLNMVKQMDEEGFGNCTNTGACEVECPKGISIKNIARMNKEFLKAKL